MAHTKPAANGLKIIQRLITLADTYEKMVTDEKEKEAVGINAEYFQNTMNYYNRKYGEK